MRPFLFLIALITLPLFLGGCATYASRIGRPRADIEAGRFELAIEELKKLAEKRDKDELLYLLDLGIAYHASGRYPEAIETFLKADKIADRKDYVSLSEEAGSVLLNDDVKPYKGEDFEKILISVYLAIDYTLLNDRENALVECRRVNHKLDLMISKGKRPYQYNAFAKYLAASLFESDREYNDAFVDYRQLLKWNYGNFPYLAGPLLRMADRLRAEEELNEYRKMFPGVEDFRLGKGQGEVIVLLEQGKSPYKVPSPQFHLIPIFQKNHYLTRSGLVSFGGRRYPTHTLYDIEKVAIQELDEKAGAILAKKLGGIVAKEAAAYGVEKATDSKAFGALARIFLHLSDHADLRSWSTVPATLQLARFTVPSGRHRIALDMVTQSGGVIQAAKVWENVEVKPGQIVFLAHRSVE